AWLRRLGCSMRRTCSDDTHFLCDAHPRLKRGWGYGMATAGHGTDREFCQRRSATVATTNVLSSGLSTSCIATITSYSVVVRSDRIASSCIPVPTFVTSPGSITQTRPVLLPCPCTSVIAAAPHLFPGIAFRVEVR